MNIEHCVNYLMLMNINPNFNMYFRCQRTTVDDKKVLSLKMFLNIISKNQIFVFHNIIWSLNCLHSTPYNSTLSPRWFYFDHYKL